MSNPHSQDRKLTMLKIKVTEKSGASIEYFGGDEILSRLSEMGHGLPERPEIGENGQPTGNILPAEYTVEVTDTTAQVEQDRVNRGALEYLASTDWMAIRASEGGKPMPEEVKQARAEARARIVR
jgi:hypothetical protein